MENQLQTAVALLWVIGLSVLTVMPLLAWVMLTSRRDTSAKIWFTGMGFYAAGAFLLATQQWVTGWMPLVGGPAIAFVMVLCMYEALRRDLDPGTTPWWLLTLGWCIFAGGAILFYGMGLRTTGGQLYASVVWTIAEGLVFTQAMRLRKVHASRGALVIAVAMLMGMSSHVLRIIYIGGVNGSIHLLDLKPVTNYFYLINIIGVTLCSFGYWGYVLEKTQHNELRLQAQALAARSEAQLAMAHAQEMRVLVQQRDQMLMLYSRFSAINSLAIFNSAVVHEVSQPVQAISLCLDHAAFQADRTAADAMRGPLQDARHQVGKLASLLTVLRKLVSTQEDDVEVVQLSDVEREILPVLRSEVSRRGVVWLEQLEIREGTVNANKVLLERLLLNLVGNALDAVSEQIARGETANIRLCVSRDDSGGAARLRMVVEDDGPGLPQTDRLLVTEAFQSTKADGLGVGLAFARLIVRQWGGELSIENLDDGQRGARATLSLPMQA